MKPAPPDIITLTVESLLDDQHPPANYKPERCNHCYGTGLQYFSPRLRTCLRLVRRERTGMSGQLFAVEQSEKTSDDYLTPRWIFETLDITFDLDVAAPPWETHVPAVRKFTKADDGLTQPWEGRVWMNPPYSQPNAWARRFIEHGHGIALLPFSQSQWTIDLWNTDATLMLPPKWFDFEGTRPGFSTGSMWCPVFFAAFGADCEDAIRRLGRVR